MLGVDIPEISKDDQPVYYAQLRSEGDALQQSQNAGTKQSVSATTYKICRHCPVTSSTRHMDCDPLDANSIFKLTTWESFLRDHKIVRLLGKYASKWLGVDGTGGAFGGVPFYDPVSGSPGDTTMHTIVTVALLQLEPFSRHLFKTTALTPAKFNQALMDFEWSERDKMDIPSTQNSQAFESGNHILWSSAQTMCFVRNSLKILAEFVDPSDEHWQCWKLFVLFVEQINAARFSWATVTELRDTLKEHHTRYRRLYPNRIIPKWHYLWHCVLFLLLHGNLWQHGCWKGESLIRIFKRWAQRLTSKNPMVQMARMYARKVAVQKFFDAEHGSDPATMAVGLYAESVSTDHEASDWSSSLYNDTAVQQHLGATDVAPIVYWYKQVRHMSDPMRIGSYFLGRVGDGSVLSSVQGIIKVCGAVFLLHFVYGSSNVQDALGQHALVDSRSDSIALLNLGVVPIRLVSVRIIGNKIYF